MEFGRIQAHALLYIQHIVFDKLEISTTLKMAAFKSHGAYFLIEYLKQVKGLREKVSLLVMWMNFNCKSGVKTKSDYYRNNGNTKTGKV